MVTQHFLTLELNGTMHTLSLRHYIFTSVRVEDGKIMKREIAQENRWQTVKLAYSTVKSANMRQFEVVEHKIQATRIASHVVGIDLKTRITNTVMQVMR